MRRNRETMLGKILSDLLARAVEDAKITSSTPIPKTDPPTKIIMGVAPKTDVPRAGEGHTDAHETHSVEEHIKRKKKLPDKLVTELGFPCPVDGNLLPHIHDIEWFRYPGIDEPIPHIILWKVDEA